MRRVRIPLLSIADTLYRSKYRGHGRSNVTVKLDLYRTVATINVCHGNVEIDGGKGD
ncbi:putative pentatricopeptide repeat-containing protein [Corchorus olitorius]|uniref:Pentatricopeptide repeat-containing protein n=1 Tax=Corchorus olitorius TaxID=93759 RepID=A0A1R3KVM9_9ROSI|nr:putative pentatricopeptide repeat-containing protein [Corchorus olitorius]